MSIENQVVDELLRSCTDDDASEMVNVLTKNKFDLETEFHFSVPTTGKFDANVLERHALRKGTLLAYCLYKNYKKCVMVLEKLGAKSKKILKFPIYRDMACSFEKKKFYQTLLDVCEELKWDSNALHFLFSNLDDSGMTLSQYEKIKFSSWKKVLDDLDEITIHGYENLIHLPQIKKLCLDISTHVKENKLDVFKAPILEGVLLERGWINDTYDCKNDKFV